MIQVTLHANEFQFNGEYNGHQYTSLKVDRTSNGRVYFVTIKNNMRLSSMAKQMKLVNGEVVISFGKEKLVIGTYVDTEAIEETPVNETNEPIEEVETIEEQATNKEEEVVTVDYSSLNGHGQCVAYRNNRYINGTMVYFNPKGNESIVIPVPANNHDKYWEIQNFIFSIMKEHGRESDFWSILINELNNKYINFNTQSETTKQPKEQKQPKKVNKPIEKINMVADYASIIYSGKQAAITFTNNKETNTIYFDRKKSWSHRKYIDYALKETGIQPSWEFRYGWEIVS